MSEPTPRLRDELFRIRTRLLLAGAFLVIVPLFGLSFARIYERELLRSEEEGLSAVATALAAALAAEGAETPSLTAASLSPGVVAAAKEAAAKIRAQVRILDGAGRPLLDTGAERVPVLTKGRVLLPRDYRALPEVAVGDSPPEGGTYAARLEIEQALAGRAGRATRVSQRLRAVRLFVAEPVLAAPAGPVPAAAPAASAGSQASPAASAGSQASPAASAGSQASPASLAPAAGPAPPVPRARGVVYVTRTTYPVLVSLYRVRNGLLRVAAVSLVVAGVLTLFLSLTISRPLRRLTGAARRIAAGERHVPLRLRGRDEIAELARTFDAMARELDARLSYISELAANVSHEFKTPIASIRGAAELLQEGAADEPAARARFLTNILKDCERLALLTTRLLQLSRIEAHREPAAPLDYQALLQEVTARLGSAEHPVTLDYRAGAGRLLGVAEQLDSVLSNLIDNAVRFSPPGAAVAVRVEEDEAGTLRTEVTDQGAGISAGNLGKVWDRFFTTARDRGGTGLGLSIVRAVVEAHGGEVGARSQEGAGSTFWFTLPRRR